MDPVMPPPPGHPVMPPPPGTDPSMHMMPPAPAPPVFGNPNPHAPGMMPPMAPGQPYQSPGMPMHPGAQAQLVQDHGNMAQYNAAYMSVEQIMNTVVTGFYIKQRMDAMEIITGFDMANRYYVHELAPRGPDGKAHMKVLFECHEASDFVERNFAPQGCRAIDVDIRKWISGPEIPDRDIAIRLEKECQCTCYCANRPMMKVFLTERGQKLYLGQIVDPWDCCNYAFDIEDAQGNKRFHVEAGCCQLGFHCKCPCEPCERIEFDLYSGDKQEKHIPILKLGTGNCFKNAVSTADNFTVTFPPNCLWTDKVLLMAALLMIDYMMFETKEENNRNHRRGDLLY